METKIICGANELDGSRWVGRTAEQVRQELGSVLNIPPEAVVRMDDAEADPRTAVLQPGHTLEFVKPAGSKGAE